MKNTIKKVLKLEDEIKRIEEEIKKLDDKSAKRILYVDLLKCLNNVYDEI